MKILFLTRVHPPVTGGLENQSYNLVTNFKKINRDTFVIKNTKGKKALPLFLPRAYLKAKSLIKKYGITHVHLSDGVLAPLGARLKKKTGVNVAVTIHGLDVTFQNKYYQKYVPKAIAKLDTIISISENTKKEMLARGIPKEKIVIVPNGVNIDQYYIPGKKTDLRKKLEKELKMNFGKKKILFTSGRLVKRKGVAWFVNNVMPKLGKNYVHLIAGSGEMKEKIEQAISKKKLDNVHLLGRVSDEHMNLLYNAADLFIMPNIRIKGDVEGFGLVAIEAGSCGLPVVAANVDGIPAAIKDGKTGWLIREKDVSGFVRKIKSGKLERGKVRAAVKKYFDWRNIVREYKRVIEGVK